VQTGQTVSPNALKPARIGSLYYLISFLSAGSYSPFIYVYFSVLGLSGEQIGWLASLMPMMMLFATPIASLADRRRWRVRITQVALAGLSITLFLLRIPTTFSGIAWLMLFLAIFSSPVMTVTDSLIARMAQRNNLNYGGMRLWGSFGYATSALIFGALWQHLGFKPMFLVSCFLLFPLIWIAGRLEEGPNYIKEDQKPISVLFRDAGFVLILIASFLAGVSNSISMTFAGIYARSLGGGNFLIGMMAAFGAYFELPTMFYNEHISRRLRGLNSVILAYGLMASAYLGYILVAAPDALPIFSILKGLGFGLWFAVTVRIVTERTPEEWASTAQSLLEYGMFGLAPLVAGPLGGLIYDRISPAAVFGLGILALVLAAMVLWLDSIRERLH
jgi:PPP family 3-phenylpropionic acid transporter